MYVKLVLTYRSNCPACMKMQKKVPNINVCVQVSMKIPLMVTRKYVYPACLKIQETVPGINVSQLS